MNEILLMLPGPTTADPRVLQAMGKAVVNHRGDEFGEIYTETTQLMSKTFQTENDSYILTHPYWFRNFCNGSSSFQPC